MGSMAEFAIIWGLVKNGMAVVQKGLKYKSTRKNLKSTVENLSPMVEDMEQRMKNMGLPTEQVEKLKEKLSENKKALARHKIGWLNFLYAPEYETKLSEGLTSIEGFISKEIQLVMLQHLVEILSILTAHSHPSSKISAQNTGTAQMLKDHHLDFRYPKFPVGLNGESMAGLRIKLLHGSEQVLNLYGLPGSGKTTLATKLCLDDQVKGKFNENIIFETLGSQIQVDEAMIKKLQENVNEFGENPVLLVLDDVWPHHSKHIIGKLELRSPDSRILVTSRATIITVKTRFHMDKLCDKDAEKLLRHLVQSSDINFDEPGNHEILLLIVKACGGLPLALEFFGGMLNGKDIEVFQKVQYELSKGVSILGSDTKLLELLQNTLNLLVDDDECIKDCFMDLGLFPEDHKVPVTAMIDMWTELYELHEPRNINAIIFIKELLAMNLVAGIKVRRMVGMDVDNYYNNHFLIQHDLYRELATSMSLQEPLENRRRLIIDLYGNLNDPPQWWPEQSQSLAASILSISTDQKVTPSWCNIQAPDVVVLVLNLDTAEYTLPEFIKEMKNLKVLVFTNYGYSKTYLRNLELLGSLLSLKRIRLEKISIPSLCDLKNLQKLTLYMCDVNEAFKDNSIDFSEAMPNLEDLSIEYCQDLVNLPTGLFNIVAMKNLIISSCHKFISLPEEIGKLQNLEALRINHCSAFEKIMPDSITKLKNLILLDISYCVSLEKLPEEFFELQNLKRLYTTGCSRLELPDSLKVSKILKTTDNTEVSLDWLL